MTNDTAYRLGYALGLRKQGEWPDKPDQTLPMAAAGAIPGALAGGLLGSIGERPIAHKLYQLGRKLTARRGAGAARMAGKLPMGLGVLGAGAGAILPLIIQRLVAGKRQEAVQ